VVGYQLDSVLCSDRLYYGAKGYLGAKVGSNYNIVPIYNTPLLIYDLWQIVPSAWGDLWLSYAHTSPYGDPQQYAVISEGNVAHYTVPHPVYNGLRFLIPSARDSYVSEYGMIYQIHDNTWTYLTNNDYVNSSMFSQDKAYFNSANFGIYVYDGQNGSYLDVDFPGCSGNYAGMLSSDDTGRIWFTNNNRLVSYADSVFTVEYNFSGTAYFLDCISPAPDGSVWLGTQNGKILIYQNGDYTQFATLPWEDAVYQIVFGDNSEVWIRTRNAVFVWHPQSGFQVLAHEWGVSNPLSSLAKLPDGKLILTTVDGFFCYEFTAPSAAFPDTQVPQVSDAELTVYPNPSVGEVSITIKSDKRVSELKVYNLKGQLVRTIPGSSVKDYVWDTRDEQGKKVSSGIYLINALIEGKNISRRVIVRK